MSEPLDDAIQPPSGDMPAHRICRRFGNLNRWAKAIRRSPSTVQRWLMTGWVPARSAPEVYLAGQTLDPPLTHRDFFPADPRFDEPAQELQQQAAE